jgi:Spy/CpxP family protein refolding chaperone
VSATKTTIVAILVVAVTFTAGVAVGVFATHVVHVRGEHMPPVFPTKMMVNRLDRRLDLTDQQRAQVEQIIRRHHTAITTMWRGLHPRVHSEIEQANAEITRILTPEQRKKFERIKLHISGRHGRAPTRSRE